MGMASSQARLLSLTARMHDIEYKAQKLEAQKLQMANKSTQVYNEYEEALNKTKIQQKTIGSDGSSYFVDTTLKNLIVGIPGGGTSSKYIAHNIADNTMYLTAEVAERFKTANETAGSQEDKEKAFAIAMGDELGASPSYRALFREMQECLKNNHDDYTKAFIAVDKTADGASYAKPTTEQATAFGNEQYLKNMIEAGFIVLHKMTGDNITGAADEINVATDTALQEVADEVDLKKAEAKYEADMAKINAKDKKFDTDLAALEQERNAIKTEMDTLKTVAKDNVERTFKLFS